MSFGICFVLSYHSTLLRNNWAKWCKNRFCFINAKYAST